MTQPEQDREALGQALGRVPSGIFVCSCGTGDGCVPFIASWVQQVAMEPAAVSVAIDRERAALPALEASDGRFTLSILPDDGDALMKPFFGQGDPEDPFGGLATATAPNGGTYLQDGLGWLECREIARAEAGSHILVVGEVTAGAMLREGDPRVHIRKSGFHY